MSSLLLAGWVAACASATVAYWISGDIWKHYHSLHFSIGGRAIRWSGAIGEIILITLGAILVFSIDAACASVSLDQMCRDYAPYVLALVLFCTLVAYVHGVRTALIADSPIRRRLLFTYLVYGVFSTVFFAGGGLALGLVFVQMLHDDAVFAAAAAEVIRLAASPITDLDGFLRVIELSNLRADTVLGTIEDSMNPTFALAAGLFAINTIIRLTPLRGLYRTNAVIWTYSVLWGAIVLILCVGGYLYVTQYNSLIEQLIATLGGLQTMAADTFPCALQRYSELYLHLSGQKSLVAFITRMSNEWAGLAVILGALQQGVAQFSRREAAESPADKSDQAHIEKKG